MIKTRLCGCSVEVMSPKRIHYGLEEFTHVCLVCNGLMRESKVSAYNQYYGYSGYDEYAEDPEEREED